MSLSAIERLGGKSASKLLKELDEYRSGGEGEGIMALHAMGYTDRAVALPATLMREEKRP